MAPISAREIVEKKIQPLLDQVQQICRQHGIPWAVSVHAPSHEGDQTCLEYYNQPTRDIPPSLMFVIGVVRGTAMPVSVGSMGDAVKMIQKMTGGNQQDNVVDGMIKPGSFKPPEGEGSLSDFLDQFGKGKDPT